MNKCPFCESEDIYFSKKRKLFVCEDSNYDVSLDDESSQFKWVPLDEVIGLPLPDSQRRRIEDVLSYLKTGSRRMT